MFMPKYSVIGPVVLFIGNFKMTGVQDALQISFLSTKFVQPVKMAHLPDAAYQEQVFWMDAFIA